MAATITEQLTKLNQLRQQLAANLTTKGVTATATEKFNTLVPKVLEISSGETPTTTVLYDATHRDKVSLLYNGTIYSVADFTALHADFCSAKNNYALNYGTTVFGWDYSCYTCCTLPISVTSSLRTSISTVWPLVAFSRLWMVSSGIRAETGEDAGASHLIS